jgi:hypothetical protein
MPAIPAWHGRIPAIRATLDRLDQPLLDRAAIETLFGLGRRQAIRLLAALGAHQAGKTFLVTREALVEYLDALASERPIASEIARRSRVRDALLALAAESRAALPEPNQAAALAMPVAAPPRTGREGWPEGVSIDRPGELLIRFASAEELLGRIFALTEAAAADFAGFMGRIAR